MKTSLKIFFMLVVSLELFSSCKKEPPPPIYNPPILKGRLLSYYDDSPISNATIKLYYTNEIPANPDEVVTTDAMGYFDYKQVKDTQVIAIPSLSGWWCPFEQGYALSNPGDAFENDSIIYLFHQGTIKVNVHIQTPVSLPFTGKYKASDFVLLPKLSSVNGYWSMDEWLGFSNDTGTYKFELSTIAGFNNSVWFSMERYSYFSNDPYYTFQDSISFYSDTLNSEPEIDFYY